MPPPIWQSTGWEAAKWRYARHENIWVCGETICTNKKLANTNRLVRTMNLP